MGQPCGICWRICSLLSLFLTSFFCSISALLLFHTFCILLLSSSRNPSTTFIPGTRDLVFWQKAAEMNKKNPLLAAFPVAAGDQQHCRGVLTADEGLHETSSHFAVRGPLSHSPGISLVGLHLLPAFFGHSLHELSCISLAGTWILLFPMLLAWLLSLCPSCCSYCSLSLIFLQLLSCCYTHTFCLFFSSSVLPPPLGSLPLLQYLVGKRCFHTSGSRGVFDACIRKLIYIFFVLLVPCCVFQVAFCWYSSAVFWWELTIVLRDYC